MGEKTEDETASLLEQMEAALAKGHLPADQKDLWRLLFRQLAKAQRQTQERDIRIDAVLARFESDGR